MSGILSSIVYGALMTRDFIKQLISPLEITRYSVDEYEDVPKRYIGPIERPHQWFYRNPLDPNPTRLVLEYLMKSDLDEPICACYVRSLGHVVYGRRASRDADMEVLEIYDGHVNIYQANRFVKGYKLVGEGRDPALVKI